MTDEKKKKAETKEEKKLDVLVMKGKGSIARNIWGVPGSWVPGEKKTLKELGIKKAEAREWVARSNGRLKLTGGE